MAFRIFPIDRFFHTVSLVFGDLVYIRNYLGTVRIRIYREKPFKCTLLAPFAFLSAYVAYSIDVLVGVRCR